MNTSMTPGRTTVAVGMALVFMWALLSLASEPTSAADHRDSALLTADPAGDLADVYAFESPNTTGNVVLAMTVSGLIPPSEAGTTYFDPDVLYQFMIDTDGDAIEDRVIQAYVTGSGSNQIVHVRGPSAPITVGATHTLLGGPDGVQVQISGTGSATIGTGNGMQLFAGVRDDPFFFDLGRFNDIIAGNETRFRDPGVDALAGTNVLAIVVELPAAMLGSGPYRIWATTAR